MHPFNLVMLVIGIIVLIFGIATFFLPSLSRWINLPGPPAVKAIGASITGIILIIVGLIVEVPLE